MSKTKHACIFSIEKLLEGKEFAYLWTFTVKEHGLPVELVSQRWAKTSKDLVRILDFQGVRVFEMHPGGHGLHVHAIVSDRYDVKKVREITSKNGFGRINVVRIEAGRAAYVAKYLNKTYRDDRLKKKRLWQCVGRFKGVKVKDVEINSPFSRRFQNEKAIYLLETRQDVSDLDRKDYWQIYNRTQCVLESIARDRAEGDYGTINI